LYLLCTPEIASVGLTEKQAKEKGYELKIGRIPSQHQEKQKLLEHQTDL
jgi:dihydrolipoamide dehydrogenase